MDACTRIDDDALMIAHYVGEHRGDTIPVRIGWALTRAVQEGDYERATHCENIVRTYPGRQEVDIASASIRDGAKVRIKEGALLTPGHWIISRHQHWTMQDSRHWFETAIAAGVKYAWLGAFETAVPWGHKDPRRVFCNQASAESVGFHSASIFGPADWAAICMSHPVGYDYTMQFYAERGIYLPKHPLE